MTQSINNFTYSSVIRIFIFSIIVGLTSVIATSCSEPTMEEDAQKAAQLTALSNKYSMENDMTNAASAYTKSEKIMNKYKDLGKFEEFYSLYISSLQDQAAIIDENNVAKERENKENPKQEKSK